MKKARLIWTTLLGGAAMFGIALQAVAQKELPAVTVTVGNYKYLNAVNPEEAAQPVNMLQQYAAAYDIKTADFYSEEHDNYVISFYIPDGRILASYDKEGHLQSTAERYKDVALPNSVREAAARKYPQWTMTNDLYLVSYYTKNGATKKLYKLVLANGDKRIRVKISDTGDLL